MKDFSEEGGISYQISKVQFKEPALFNIDVTHMLGGMLTFEGKQHHLTPLCYLALQLAALTSHLNHSF